MKRLAIRETIGGFTRAKLKDIVDLSSICAINFDAVQR
jgi:hypothetical protein